MREASVRSGVPLDLDQIEAVALTHLHADHASGLEGLGFFSHFVLGRRARLAVHPDVARRLWDGHLAAGMEVLHDPAHGPIARTRDDFFDVIPLAEATAVRVGSFEIECRRTRHHVPTTALRIRAGGLRRGGRGGACRWGGVHGAEERGAGRPARPGELDATGLMLRVR